MIYEEAVYRPAGNAYVIVEFGDEVDIALSFRVIALDEAIGKSKISAITETVATHRSLGVVYDALKMPYAEVVAELKRLEELAIGLNELPSRIVEIPIWYDDPWSQECAQAHGRSNDVEYIAALNHITVPEVIETHSGTLHWVGAVGFSPGNFQAFPLDLSKVMTAPKYPVPRKWTYERIICYAGFLTSAYPVASPGGYQLLGRTPIEFYDPQQRNSAFRESPVLARVGDRHRYVPVGEEEYWAIRREVEANTYAYKLQDDSFNLRQYLTEAGRTV